MASDDKAKELYYEHLAQSHDWDEIANRYETRRRLELVFERVLGTDTLRGRRFLDAGSGGGHFSAVAAARGAHVTSLDLGQQLLRQVAARCESHLVLGSVRQLPFPDEFFEVVLSTEVIEHLPEPIAGLRELCRVVSAGGLLIVTTPSRLWQPVVRLASRLRLRPYRGHENFSWPGDLVRVAKDSRLGIDTIEGFNFCPLFWQGLDPVFRAFDRRVGRLVPWLMVNLVLVAHRERAG